MGSEAKETAALALSLVANGEWRALAEISSSFVNERAKFLDLNPSDQSIDRLEFFVVGFQPLNSPEVRKNQMESIRDMVLRHDPFLTGADAGCREVRFRALDVETVLCAVLAVPALDDSEQQDVIIILLQQPAEGSDRRCRWLYHDMILGKWRRNFAEGNSVGWKSDSTTAILESKQLLSQCGPAAQEDEYWIAYDEALRASEEPPEVEAAAANKEEGEGNEADYWDLY